MQQAFDVKVQDCLVRPDGAMGHATLKIGDSIVMPASLYLHLALQAGGAAVMEPADMFWGDRHGGVKDGWGNVWLLAAHVEDVSGPEVNRGAEVFFTQQRAAG